MRSFACLFLLSFVSSACRPEDDVAVVPPRPELVEIGLPEPGDLLMFLLPDAGWRRLEEASFDGFLYGKEGRTLRVRIVLKEDRFDAVVDAVRFASSDEDVRAFTVGRAWPFVGIVLSYRGPPDAELLDAFIRSFKVERR
ncbi:MAG TPA: hypothetical protein VJ694_03330 [Patescibacteria group bacterium]|nr:hypothetical protein [Patescibacteria group bacterium]